MGDCTCALLFVGLCHGLSSRCIGQLYTIRRLLSDILDVVQKRLFHLGENLVIKDQHVH